MPVRKPKVPRHDGRGAGWMKCHSGASSHIERHSATFSAEPDRDRSARRRLSGPRPDQGGVAPPVSAAASPSCFFSSKCSVSFLTPSKPAPGSTLFKPSTAANRRLKRSSLKRDGKVVTPSLPTGADRCRSRLGAACSDLRSKVVTWQVPMNSAKQSCHPHRLRGRRIQRSVEAQALQCERVIARRSSGGGRRGMKSRPQPA